MANKVLELRFIDDCKHAAEENMAIDESILLNKIPTFRLYGWSPPAVSIGYFQGLEEEVDVRACDEDGIDIVRRLTGGGAVYHDCELTYSMALPEDSFISRDILTSYRQICSYIINALNDLDIVASFHGINDILVGDKKISGNAQTRRGGMILQHGTIILGLDAKRMFRYLKVPTEKLRDKAVEAVKDRVTSISEISEGIGIRVDEEMIREAILNRLMQDSGMRVIPGRLTGEERDTAILLAKEKYATKEWTRKRL